jgi:hypothetical protein
MRLDTRLKSFQFIKQLLPPGGITLYRLEYLSNSIEPLTVLFQAQYVRLSQACQHCSGAYTREA